MRLKVIEDKYLKILEKYLNGEELSFLNKHGDPQYNPEVWQMFLRFTEFWETYNPKLIETEVHLFSDELKVAGTCDLICEIDGKLWLWQSIAKDVVNKSTRNV